MALYLAGIWEANYVCVGSEWALLLQAGNLLPIFSFLLSSLGYDDSRISKIRLLLVPNVSNFLLKREASLHSGNSNSLSLHF